MKKRINYLIGIYAILLVIAVIIMWISNEEKWVNKINLFGTTISIEILYFLASLRIIGPDKKGVLLLFGKPVEKVEPGLTFVPFLIMTLRTESGLIIQNELPCEPEKIWRTKEGETNQTIPEGFFPPIRITFGPPKGITDPDNPDFVGIENPYDKQITTEITPVISWRITDMILFVGTIGTIERTVRQMEDVAIAQFTINFAKITPALALKQLEQHSSELKKAIEERVKNWGIEIVSAQIKPIGFSHKLNQSVIDVAEAEQGAKATKIKSGAEKQKRTDEGAGTAEAEKLLLQARAIGIEKLSELCKTPEGQIALWMNTLSEALKNSQYSIIPGSELFTSVSGIKEMLDKIKGGLK